jgi:hypothetical protein
MKSEQRAPKQDPYKHTTYMSTWLVKWFDIEVGSILKVNLQF